MAMILLAVEDTGRDAAVRDLLTAEGWWVTTVGSQDEALRAAADHAPQLLIVDPRLAHADSLVRAFGRRDGGPGVLLLLDQADQALPAGVGSEDGLLARDQPPAEVLARVRRSLETVRGGETSPRVQAEADSERQLTATDLFGDILAHLGEVGDTRRAAPSRPAPPLLDEVAPAVPEHQAESAVPEPESGADDEPARPAAPPEAAEPIEAAQPAEPAEPIEPTEPIEPIEPIGAPELDTAPESAPEPVSAEPEAAEHRGIGGTEPIEALGPPAAEDPVTATATPEPGADETVGGAGADLGYEAADLLEPTEVEPPPVEATDEVLDEGLEEAGERPSEPDSDAISIHDVLAAAEAPEREDVAEVEADALEDDLAWLDELDAVEEEGAGEAPEQAAESPSSAEDGDEGPEESQPVPVHDAVGPYRLLELLEFGDLSERWLAVGLDGDERVVVERIRHELRDRADVREAFVEGHTEAAGWEHEGILRVLDLGREGEVDYVVTEHCPGHSLREVLTRVRRMDARMPLGICLVLVERLASALQAIGEGPTGSRHGWLVPGSVWLGEGGRVVLREFGCGRLGPVDEAPVRDWKDYRFLAPEFWTGKPDVRSDLYSLGALLYEMVSTHPVHDGEDLETLRLAVTTEDVESVQRVDPTVPSEVDAWIMRLLRRQVEERTPAVMEIQSKVDLALQALPTRPSEAEVAAYLRQLFTARMPELPEEEAEVPGRMEVEVAESPVEEPTSEAPSRHWWWIAAALVALALVVYLLWGRGPGGSAPAQDEPNPAVPAAVEPASAEIPDVEASTGTAPPEPSPAATDAVTARPPEPVAPRQEDLDVAGLVAEEFARRQRDLDQRLRALEEAQAAQAAAAAGETPPAEAEEPPASDGGDDDGGGPPAALQ